MHRRSSSDLTCALYKKLIKYRSWCTGKNFALLIMNVLDAWQQCLHSGLLPEPSSRTQLAKGLFLRNAFIQMQFVAGSWVVSRGWVTLLKGGKKLNGRVILLPGLCCGLPDSYQCNWTLDSRGHGSWITHKRQWAHAEEVGLQVTWSGCALFVGFLLVIHSNEVKWAEQAHQGWSNHFSWMKKANMDITVTGRSGKTGGLLNQWVLFLSILLFLPCMHHYIEKKSHLYKCNKFVFSSRDLICQENGLFCCKDKRLQPECQGSY